MSMEDQSKYKNALWWITSIAVSVLCCSVLFVVFASYLVDLKADIRDNMMHVSAMEERQNQILAKLEMLSKRLPAPVATPAVAPTTDATPAGGEAPAAATDGASGAPPASVTVPVMPASPEKP